jgi:ATP synthase protein I
MSKDNNLGQGLGIAFRLGTELVAATLIGALMGYAVDYYLGTKPWGIVAGLFLGGAAGFLTVYRTSMSLQLEEQENDGDVPPDKKEEDS